MNVRMRLVPRLLAVAVLALGASAWAGPDTMAVGGTRVVYASKGVVVRAEANDLGAPVGSLPKGTLVKVLEIQLPWAKVEGAPGAGKPAISGWVRAYQVEDPAMIAAYKTGLPAAGRKFPDGARMAKIHWTTVQNSEGGSPATVPGNLRDIDFMMKDATRFAATGGWGYAQFNHDNATGNFTPLGTGVGCGFACHTKVAAKDYVFTAFPKR